jgi:hypothetical protein
MLKDTAGSRLFSLDEMAGKDDDGVNRIAGDVANPMDTYQHDSLQAQIATVKRLRLARQKGGHR